MTNDERDSSLVLRPPSDGHADGAGSRATPGASSGYLGGVVIGLGAGLVWTPCAGPILAAITALAATQSLTVPAGLIAVAYGTGAAVPLMLVARSGRALAGGVRWLRPQARRVRASFAAVMLAMSVLVVTGRDAGIQSALAAAGPAGVGAWIDRVEQAPVVRRWLASLFDDTFYGRSPGPPRKSVPERLPAAPSEPQLSVIGPAPDFEGISAWFNTSHPLTIQSLRGKVVLVDFWTYSCINCLRTLPYLRAWHDTYKDAGLVVVGVHTPEFAFEAEPRNVQAAIARERITYPVALDAKYETWRAYRNRFWPSKYLIDAQGRMRFYHSGEGAYVETERAIRALLVEAGMMLPGEMARLPGEPFVSSTATPETYLGWQRLEQAQYASPQPIGKNKEQRYSAPATPPLHNLAFDGLWTIHEEYAAAGAGAQLALRFTANHVYLVMAPGGPQPAQVRVMLDGQPISRELSGADVRSGAVIVDEARLYHLVDLKGQHGTHTLRLAFEQGGTESYAFTFG